MLTVGSHNHIYDNETAVHARNNGQKRTMTPQTPHNGARRTGCKLIYIAGFACTSSQ